MEKFGLKFARSGPADALMKATESDIASSRQLTEEEVAKGNGPLGLTTAVALPLVLALVYSN